MLRLICLDNDNSPDWPLWLIFLALKQFRSKLVFSAGGCCNVLRMAFLMTLFCDNGSYYMDLQTLAAPRTSTIASLCYTNYEKSRAHVRLKVQSVSTIVTEYCLIHICPVDPSILSVGRANFQFYGCLVYFSFLFFFE